MPRFAFFHGDSIAAFFCFPTSLTRITVSHIRRHSFAAVLFLLVLFPALGIPVVARAERSVSFVLNTYLSQQYAAPRDNPSISAGALWEGDYPNDGSSARSLTNYIDPECAGTLAVEAMEVSGLGAQVLYAPYMGAVRAPFFVLSPVFRNVFGEYVNNGGVTLTFRLAGDTPWNVSAIGLDIVNYDRYLYPGEDTGATGTFSVNGHQVQCPDDAVPASIRLELDPQERELSEITVSAGTAASAAFRRITLYLADAPEFIGTDDPRASEPEFSFNGVYDIPFCPAGPLGSTDRMECAVFDAAGRRMNVTAEAQDTGFRISCYRDGEDVLEEGVYRAVCYLPDGQYEPVPEDGAEFLILPTAQGMFLNWEPVDLTSRTCNVPSTAQRTDAAGNTVHHDWEHVLLNGLRPGTTVYWKVSSDDEDDPGSDTLPFAGRATSLRAPASIPDGYRKMENLSVDLSGGNNLSLILRKNGINSYPVEIHYTRNDIPTSVCVPLDAAKAASVTWFDLQGRPVIAPKSGMTLLRVDIMPDGSVRSKKVFIP